MRLAVFILLSYVFALLGCKQPRQAADANPPGESQFDEPQLVFLNYELRSDSTSGAEELELVNFIITKGVLKEKPESVKTPKAGDLVCTFADAAMQPLYRIIVADPVSVSVEYVDANGQLAKKEIRQAKARFSIRAQLPAKSRHVLVEKILPEAGLKKELLISKISQP